MRLQQLKEANSLSDLAHVLGYRSRSLAFILYGGEILYRQFEIPKKSGGTRVINAPEEKLKLLQSRLNTLLLNCVDDINKEKSIKQSISHGFSRNTSIITNAQRHRKKRYVLNLDLSNFFDEINFGRVRGFFIKNNNFKLNPAVATVIAQIACHENKLPQGSPSSPVISNLIAHILDIRLLKLANTNKCSYSRYADDLSFSTNQKSFPTNLAYPSLDNPNVHLPGEEIIQLIGNSGFSINNKKTRLQVAQRRQDVTGLIVNKKINSKSEYWRQTRAMVHNLLTNDSFQVYDLENKTMRAGRVNELKGRLSFIFYIDSYNRELERLISWRRGEKRISEYSSNQKLSSRENTYKEFLHYSLLIKPEKPLLICEGETDNVYIKSALKSLFKNFPELISKDDNEFNINLNFLRTSNTKTRLMNYPDGVSGLNKLINSHHEFQKKYHKNFTHPVIFVTDNDNACIDIFKTVKRLSGAACDGSKESYHIFDNLYLIPIPKIDNKPTVIEHLFTPETLNTAVKGKKFNFEGKNINPETEYGKKAFAETVVRPNYSSIDFSSFEQMLNAIKSVIENHKPNE